MRVRVIVGDLQVCVRLVKRKEGIGGMWGAAGRQRDAPLRSQGVLQGCGNVVLGSAPLTCAAGRWRRQCAS